LRVLPGASLPSAAQGMFAFGNPGALAGILKNAGFRDTDEKFVTVPWTWAGPPEDVWAYFQDSAVPFAALLKSIPPDRRPEIDEAVLRAISQYYDGAEIKFTATLNLTSATK